ncbi:transposase-like zinc-binding domain-containing protein [Mobiluncus mulieris]
MPRKPSNRKCLTCGKTGVKKNGTTTSGAIRWRCNNCGASWSNIRDDISSLSSFLCKWGLVCYIVGNLSG